MTCSLSPFFSVSLQVHLLSLRLFIVLQSVTILRLVKLAMAAATAVKVGPHSPENAVERQAKFLSILNWFTRWRILHDENVTKEDANESIFLLTRLGFASELYSWHMLERFK